MSINTKEAAITAESKLRAIKLHGLDNLNAQIVIEEVADLLAQIREAHEAEISKAIDGERDRCARIAIGEVRRAIKGE